MLQLDPEHCPWSAVVVVGAETRDARNMMMRIAVATFVLSAACSGRKDKQNDLAGSAATAMKPTVPEAAKPPTPVEVTAKQLYADYKKDEHGAKSRYEGKILLVTGTLSRVGKDIIEQDDPPIVLFATPPGEVQANVGDAAKTLKPGQTVALQCTGAGFELATPILVDCSIQK